MTVRRSAGELGAGGRLLMHCGAGIGRAGTVAAGLLMRLGEGRAAAEARVAASRPEAGAQAELLAALESLARLDGPPRQSGHD